MPATEHERRVVVTVIYSPQARRTREWVIEVPAGTRVEQALERTVLAEYPDLRGAQPDVGIWGGKVSWTQVLAQGDRLEIYRTLQVDPKTARRERFKQQGAKSAGLFASRRAGAKAGY